MNLALKKFDITSITSDKVVVFIGKRNTGKSFLVKDLLYHHRKIPVGTVISGTEAANPFYSTMVPSIFIHDQYSPEIINHALDQEWIKTSRPKAKDPAAPKEPKDKGQSKWTAYQKWAKKWADWNDVTMDRATMKEIYAGYGEAELKEWQRVAEELNAGKNIRDIENKPEIRMPKKDEPAAE